MAANAVVIFIIHVAGHDPPPAIAVRVFRRNPLELLSGTLKAHRGTIVGYEEERIATGPRKPASPQSSFQLATIAYVPKGPPILRPNRRLFPTSFARVVKTPVARTNEQMLRYRTHHFILSVTDHAPRTALIPLQSMMLNPTLRCHKMTATAELAPTTNRGQFRRNDPRNTTDRPTTQLQEARRIQRLLFARCQNPKVGDVALSSLARAFCLVQDTIREIRGIPCAGQYRPEITEKRARNVIELARSDTRFAEATPSDPKPTTPEGETPPLAHNTRPTTDPKKGKRAPVNEAPTTRDAGKESLSKPNP